jgi:DNA-binding winged helix-turn-helix (wHTH) protein/tetratricopeptide (TPR) repeat protein
MGAKSDESGSAASMEEFPPFRLDTVNECLWRYGDGGNDERVLLPPKAFAMLRYLVKHAGRLVTQNELLEALWPETFVQPEVLKSHIRDIRVLLGDDSKKPRFIETLPRRGYRFVARVSEGSAESTIELEPPPRKLVGRHAALSRLRESLRSASRGQRQIVFVTGEPGIGKTALLDEFQRQAARDVPGIRLGRGQCVEGYGAKEAYYPVLEAFGLLCRGPAGEAVIQVLATHAPTWLVQFPGLVKREQREVLEREILGATRERMLREICEAVEMIASETLLLVILEDLHWTDPSTVDLLSALARRRQRAKLILIGTCRPVDLVISQHPLKAVKQDLLIHHLGQEIAVEPLDESDVAEYLEAESRGAAVPVGLARLLHGHTEGNPLFMVAALEHMEQRGLIFHDNVTWKLKVRLEEIYLDVPESLRQMIEAQIERLSPEEQQVLELASLESGGRSRFGVVPRAAMEGIEPEAFEKVCGELVRRHCILRAALSERLPDGTVTPYYEFVHELYREVCYQRITPGRRARLHRRLGEWAEAHLEQLSDVAAWLAGHFEQAGDWPRAVKYLQLAADKASRRFEARQAAEILEHTLELAERLPRSDRAMREVEILKKLADTYAVFGIQFKTWPDFDDLRILEIQEALIARSAQHGLTDVQIGALIGLAFSAGWISSERCFIALERALQLSAKQQDPLARARTRMTCFSWRVCVAGWNWNDVEGCRNALAEIRAAGDRLALALHLIDFTVVRFHMSEYRDGVGDVKESLALLSEEAKKDPHLLAQPLGYLPLALHSVFLGNWEDALLNFNAGTAFWDKNANQVYARALRIHLAWLHLHAQDFSGVRAICESALPLIRLPNQRLQPQSRIYGHEFVMSLILTGSADTALGNYDRAYEYLVTAAEEMDRQTIAFGWYFRVLVASAFTELFLAKGDVLQAQAHGAAALELACATAEHTNQALAWEVNARVALAEDDVQRAQHCITQAVSALEGYEVPLAAWRVHATACAFYQYSGDENMAEQHQALSCETIMRIANTLPAEEALRQIFLSSPTVRKTLDRAQVDLTYPKYPAP